VEANPQAHAAEYKNLPDEKDAWASDKRVGKVYDERMHRPH
jgi:hypothetical protein